MKDQTIIEHDPVGPWMNGHDSDRVDFALSFDFRFVLKLISYVVICHDRGGCFGAESFQHFKHSYLFLIHNLQAKKK